ncbi:MAG: hypothetical protein KJN70_13875 [Eudoraea sp.]|nr:hypothetical protein [Eudoraea sp.]
MRFKVFLYELQRRHVIKAAVAYLVVAWLIAQVLSIMTDAFNIPKQTLSLSIIVMMICFPIWLLINWFYDITEEGIVKVQKEDVETESISVKSGNLNKIIITTLSVIVVLLLFNTIRMSAERKATETIDVPELPRFKSSVAVLAFADMSPEHDKEHLADGMSEEILNKLAKYKELRVIGRTSSFYYKNNEATIAEIGKELDVAYILEGSIRQSMDLFRITVQLIDVSDGSHVWSNTFDRTIEDALQIQDEIATVVAERLEVTLLNGEIREHKLDPEAYDLYLKANQEANKYQKEAILKADSLVRRSLELDDTYSPAWALLAYVTYSKAFEYFLLKPEIAIESGKLAAQKAVENDSTNAMGYVWQSKFSWQMKNVDQAAFFIQKALEIAPNDPRILEQAGYFSLHLNKIDEAEVFFEKSIMLDPRRRLANYKMAFVKWVQGDMDEALRYLETVYAYGLPDYFKNYEMALIHRDRGDFEKAVAWMEKEEDPYLKILLNCSIQYALGNEKEAREILEEIKNMTFKDVATETIDSNPEHDYEIACIYAYMKKADSAFVYLDRAYEHVLNMPEYFFTMPDFNNLKEDPRWDAYLKRMGEDMQYDFLTNR